MTGSRNAATDLDAKNLRIAIVAARFNDDIVTSLIDAAQRTFLQFGASDSDIDLVRVPGAWELPLAAQRLARKRQYDVIVALGAVIRGGTAHFEYVSAQCAAGLARVALEQDLPVAFGVLTCDTMQQAAERSAPDDNNKGVEAAIATIEMAQLLRRLER